MLPWWLELVGAAILGASLLFGGLLVAGHSDLLPLWLTTRTITPGGTEAHPGKIQDDLTLPTRKVVTFPGKEADDLVVPHSGS